MPGAASASKPGVHHTWSSAGGGIPSRDREVRVLAPNTCDVSSSGNRVFAEVTKMRSDETRVGPTSRDHQPHKKSAIGHGHKAIGRTPRENRPVVRASKRNAPGQHRPAGLQVSSTVTACCLWSRAMTALELTRMHTHTHTELNGYLHRNFIPQMTWMESLAPL